MVTLTKNFKQELIKREMLQDFEDLIRDCEKEYDLEFDYNTWYSVKFKKGEKLLAEFSHTSFLSFVLRLELLLERLS